MKLARLCRITLAALIPLTLAAPCLAATGVEQSLQHYTDFARSLETRAGRCDLERLDASISVEDLMQRGTGDLTVPARVRTGFLDGFKSKLSLGGQICDSLKESGSYELLRIRRVEGQPQALFRMISNSGLNYHDFLLAVGSAGGVQIVDFYNYLSGEWFSITLRRSFLPLVAESNQSLLARLTRGESAYVKNLSKILEMQHLQIEGKHNEALAIFDAFPEELKRDKNLLLMRFNIAAQADDKAYQAAMVDLKKSLPDDPALDFALIDHYFYAKQFDKALEIIDSIDKRVEGDPYLDFFRANIFYSDGNWAGAKRFAKQAIDREPDLEDPYWTLITISLDERDYAETARLLIAVEDSLGLVIGDLIDIPEYAGFRASEPYRRWLLRD